QSYLSGTINVYLFHWVLIFCVPICLTRVYVFFFYQNNAYAKASQILSPCNLSFQVAVGMLHGQNSYAEPTSSSSPMPRSVDPSQFCIDELQQKISSVTYQQKPQNSIGYDIDFLVFPFFFFSFIFTILTSTKFSFCKP
ncbi:hypothetical protein AABB24_001177, partial [Solanum stoloniferum]